MSLIYVWPEFPDADFAVIGKPVSHSLSPKMHSAAYVALGLEKSYVAVEVPEGKVGQTLNQMASRGYIGANITVPYKHEAFRWAQSTDWFCAKVKAANTVRFSDRSAINTDGPGFIATLQDKPAGRALVLGAGGSAYAVVQALSDAGWEISVWNRTAARLSEMLDRLGPIFSTAFEPSLCDFNMIVNATSAGLSGESLGLDWTEASSDALAYELAYQADLTPFEREAQAHGLPCLGGRDLLVAQGALAFEWWLGKTPDLSVMRRAIE